MCWETCCRLRIAAWRMYRFSCFWEPMCSWCSASCPRRLRTSGGPLRLPSRSCGLPDCTDHVDRPATGSADGLCPTGIRTFIQALERVADVNGIHRKRPGWLQSWQHSTIARRVAFLEGVLANPLAERHFQKRVRLIKWLLFLGLGLSLAAWHLTPEGRLGLWGL